MRHVTSSVLRRLQDEPLAVPDAARRHLDACERCQGDSTDIAEDAALASYLLTAPELLSDTDVAWMRFQAGLREPGSATKSQLSGPRVLPRRLVNASIGTGTVVAAGVLVVGVGAAAALTTVYRPTKVAPVTVSSAGLHTIADIARLGSIAGPGGLPSAGSRQLPFGNLTWTSTGRAQRVGSLAQATAMTRLTALAPARLPRGVGAPSDIMVQPKVTATIHFSTSAGGGVGGSTLVVSVGPAVLVQYGSAGRGGLKTLAVAAMQRPVASSTGASASELAAYLLARPGVPADLAQEIRLLGTASLPVPVPSGVPAQHVQVGGAPAVLIADPAGTAAGVIWEGRDGVVHGVAGLLDKEDVLNVARQLG